MRDAFGADRLLLECALEGAAHRRIAVGLQQLMQPIHVVNPDLRPPMGELRQIRQRGSAEIEQMLALYIAPRRFPETAATRGSFARRFARHKPMGLLSGANGLSQVGATLTTGYGGTQEGASSAA